MYWRYDCCHLELLSLLSSDTSLNQTGQKMQHLNIQQCDNNYCSQSPGGDPVALRDCHSRHPERGRSLLLTDACIHKNYWSTAVLLQYCYCSKYCCCCREGVERQTGRQTVGGVNEADWRSQWESPVSVCTASVPLPVFLSSVSVCLSPAVSLSARLCLSVSQSISWPESVCLSVCLSLSIAVRMVPFHYGLLITVLLLQIKCLDSVYIADDAGKDESTTRYYGYCLLLLVL